MGNLQDLYDDWSSWSRTAAKTEDGWQSDYPRWNELMQAAKFAMLNLFPSTSDLKLVEQCWAISEEGEDLADYARDHIDECWVVLTSLSTSTDATVRWQVYAVLGSAGSRAEGILRKGTEDTDAYCRRRALLSLAGIHPDDLEQLLGIALQDEDAYNRQVASEIAIREP